MIRNLSVLLFLACLGTGAALADNSRELVIRDVWIREAPPGVSTMAGYLEFINNGSETIVLYEVRSDVFERVELHRTRIEGEVARMEHKGTLTLSPGQTIRMEPGGYHLMLFNPSRSLKAGDKVKLTLAFKDRPDREVEAEIRAMTDDRGGHQHHQH